mgnify:CR=1 FL=1
MDFIRFCIENPVKVTVSVLMSLLFGMVSLMGTPVQLTPDVSEPEITVTTVWPGASAQEVEREITDEQEEQRAWLATDWLIRVQTPAWLRLAGLTRLVDREWAYLSQGERQRVLIARALMAKPRLLIRGFPQAPTLRNAGIASITTARGAAASLSCILRPVSSSQRIVAIAKTSVRASASSPSSCSGAM